MMLRELKGYKCPGCGAMLDPTDSENVKGIIICRYCNTHLQLETVKEKNTVGPRHTDAIRNIHQKIRIVAVAMAVLCLGNNRGIPITIEQAISGIYRLYIETGSGIYYAGNLTLEKTKYRFANQNRNNLPHSIAERIPRFFFILEPEGIYNITYEAKLKPGTSVAEINDESIIATIHFRTIGKKNKTEPKYQMMVLRNDRALEEICFHASQSELQLWSLTKTWDTTSITRAEAVDSALFIAKEHLSKINKSKESIELGGPFMLDSYKREVKILEKYNGKCWYVYFWYQFPKNKKVIFSGGPAHFTVTVNRSTRETHVMHGE